MWNRAILKQRCKDVMKNNYWIMFLVSAITAFLCGNSLINIDISIADITYYFSDFMVLMNSNINLSQVITQVPMMLLTEVVTSFIGIIMMIVAILALCFRFFISNPIRVGRARFYIKNTKEKATITDFFTCFSHNYMNCVKIMFLRDIKVALFSLLLIVPGIIKCYEYKMLPMILAENPSISSHEAFLKSKEITTCQKMNMFILDLSFIGWYILGSILIIGKLFVHPYYDGVQAELYKELNIL